MAATQTPPAESYYCGLDLGQAQDFTALAALARTETTQPAGLPRAGQQVARYALRGLKRWPLGTLYTQIVADVKEIVGKAPLTHCTLGIDKTGVGAAVVDMFAVANLRASLRPVLITAGHQATQGEDGTHHVPKRELVACLQVLLQERRLEIDTTLPEAKVLQRELAAFKVKVTAARNETFEADWRERAHDDLVLAVAIAAWLGERVGFWGPISAGPARESLVSRMPPGVAYQPEFRGSLYGDPYADPEANDD